MANHAIELHKRSVILVIGISARVPVASSLDQETRQVQVLGLPRLARQFDQGHLDLFVPACAFALTRSSTEHRTNMIRKTAGDPEQLLAPSHPVVSDSSLDQMPGTVQLVQVAQV
jgi:hypothetical protein